MIIFDSFPLQIIETGEGFLKAQVTFAVPGVLPYCYADGIRFEAKLPEDILSSDSIESANGKPVVDGHPYDSNGQPYAVTPANFQNLSKGAITGAHVENGKGVATIMVYDSALIDDIKNGRKTEVSMGFDHDSDNRPGIFNGVKYDSAQRNIRVNHLAIVDHARAGEATKIKLYAGDSAMETNNQTAGNAGGGKPWMYKTFDGKREFAVDGKELQDELIALNKKIKADGDALRDAHAKLSATPMTKPDEEKEGAKQDLLKQVEEHEAKEKALMEQISALMEGLTKLSEEMPGKIAAESDARMDAMDSVKSVDCSAKMDGLTTTEIRKMYIDKVYGGSIKCDGLDNVAVAAKFEAAKEMRKIMANTFTPGSSQVRQAQTVTVDAPKLAEQVESKRQAFGNAYEENQKKLRG